MARYAARSSGGADDAPEDAQRSERIEPATRRRTNDLHCARVHPDRSFPAKVGGCGGHRQRGHAGNLYKYNVATGKTLANVAVLLNDLSRRLKGVVTARRVAAVDTGAVSPSRRSNRPPAP